MSLASRELLPYYMQTARWLDLADAIDAVFGVDLDLQQKMLKYIRYQFIENEATKAKAESGELIDNSMWDVPDRKTAAEQVELSGLRFYDTGFIDQLGFVNLFRNISTHWYSKGLYDFVDFIAFNLNAKVDVLNLWTQDYITFKPEKFMTAADVPVYKPGGTWFPTTHVRLRVDSDTFTAGGNDAILLAQLFFDLANYTLVLDSIEEYLNMWIGSETDLPNDDGTVSARIVGIANTLRDRFTITTAS